MLFRVAAELRAAVGEDAQQRDVMLVEEGNGPVVEQIRRCDGRFSGIEFGESDLAVGVGKGLLVDAAHALHRADIEAILRPAITGMFALKRAVRTLLGLGPLQRRHLRLGLTLPGFVFC